MGVLAQRVIGITRPGPQEVDRLLLRVLEEDAAGEPLGASPCLCCGVFLPLGVPTEEPCAHCSGLRGGGTRTVALGGYAGGLGALVAAAKYGRWHVPLEVLGTRLGVQLLMNIPLRGRVPLLVPLPSPRLRRMHRGLDHARILAKAAAQATGWQVAAGLRRRWVPTQVGSTSSARQRGGGGLRARSGFRSVLEGRVVVLIDDVRTSGRSLHRASRLCHGLGAGSVCAGVVAVRREKYANQTLP